MQVEEAILWEKNPHESELVLVCDDIASDGQEMCKGDKKYVQMGKD